MGAALNSHTYVHKYIHTYIHTYIRTYIHTYVHTYVHTYMCHGAGAKVGWFKEYRGLTFTM